MTRPIFTIISILFVLIVLLAMWWGWRARARRDAGVLASSEAPKGALIAQFARVFYVSTTPVGQPLTRVAAPGLRYRGRADLTVRRDGVTVEIDGEQPVHLLAAQLEGSGLAGRRVGKAVEEGGLALLRWRSGERDLESSFRFDEAAEQRRFIDAIAQIPRSSATSQEGAK